MKGKVYLLGAGPGDPGLLTIKGKEVLNKADIVVYDRLVSKELLNYAPNAEYIFAGKSSKVHYMTQDETNELLSQEALKGKTVVRLKGGDPYVFGRGGEEGKYLYDRDIEFEEIPGITSAIGGLAYAGIPITYRGIATSFHVITGHLREGGDEINFEALAQLEGTLVFLMGVGNLEKIRDNLIKYGMDPNTPAAIVTKGTTYEQSTLVAKLDDIYEKAIENNVKPPSLIVVGDVVKYRKELNFFEEKPLFGENIIITREVKDTGDTIKKFRDLGANVISIPMIKTIPMESEDLNTVIEELEKYDYLVFTSRNGVRFFFDKLKENKLDARALYNAKIAVVGPKTGEELASYGLNYDLIPDKFKQEDLYDVINKDIKGDAKILVLRAKIARPLLVDKLSEIADVKDIEIYDTIPEENSSELIEEEITRLDNYKLVFTSSSTFTNFLEAVGGNEELINSGEIISIGPITSETIREAGFNVDIEAEEYTIDGIIEKLEER